MNGRFGLININGAPAVKQREEYEHAEDEGSCLSGFVRVVLFPPLCHLLTVNNIPPCSLFMPSVVFVQCEYTYVCACNGGKNWVMFTLSLCG